MMTEQFLKSFDVVAAAQETVSRAWMEQAQTARKQGQAMMHQALDQAKENQRLFQEMVQSTVRLSLESYRIATEQTLQDLQKRVDQLTREVETLRSR